jgi:tetratricopeptide (TPR) repeat protein
MRQVNLDYLAPDARHTLTKSLVQRWLKDAAKGQHDIICRTAYPISWHYANSAKDRGNLLSNDEPERAIHGWLQELLHVLGPTSNFTEPDGYPALVHTMHMTRARVAITEGDAERAARELDICEKIRPGDMRLALASLPRLRAAGMDALFDKLFQQTFQAQRQICQEFPQAATHLNNAAWICARSQRQLEEALEFAQQAVSLAPDSAAYQDTLAEVHFQLGNREAAVAAAGRSVELSGSTKQSLARLRHFSESELKTLDGTQ